jgi:uncharacterized membrane protein
MENIPHGPTYSNLPQGQLPNATAVLILGIVSLPACLCYGIPGLIAAIIALVLAKKDQALYTANPAHYTEASYKNLRTGRTCAWVGIILSALFLLFLIGVLMVVGVAIFTNPQSFL